MTSPALCFKVGIIIGTLFTANDQLKVMGQHYSVPPQTKQGIRDFAKKCHVTDEPKVQILLSEPDQ